MSQLKVGALLQGDKYKIEKVLGQGGFGITYLATQDLFDRKVCVKEFFLKELCERDEATSQVTLGTQGSREIVKRFMQKFLKEAKTISKLEHPNIIRIHDIFKENNTAYYVMDYIDGENLYDMVKSRGALPEAEAVAYVKQVAWALDFVHQRKVNHLDVKPANIMVSRSDKRAILIDFGVSKQYDAQGKQTSTTPVAISHGYAPIEQYKQGGVSTFSPQTDIYALGATLYKLVTGNTPPQAPDLIDEDLPPLPPSLSAPVVEAIKKAMQVRKKRPGCISEFLEILHTSSTDEPELPKEPDGNKDNGEIKEIVPHVEENKTQDKTQDKTQNKSQDKDPNKESNKTKKSGLWIFLIALLVGGLCIAFCENSENREPTPSLDKDSTLIEDSLVADTLANKISPTIAPDTANVVKPEDNKKTEAPKTKGVNKPVVKNPVTTNNYNKNKKTTTKPQPTNTQKVTTGGNKSSNTSNTSNTPNISNTPTQAPKRVKHEIHDELL